MASRCLKESESRFRGLVEKTSNMVVQMDGEIRLVFANAASMNLLGLSADARLGLNFLDFVHAEDVDRVDRALQQSISANENHLTIENRIPGGKGGVHDLLWSFQFTYEQNGVLKGINGIGRDITQRRRLEDQLIKAKETAEAADHSKSEFLAMISHEIRTPLNSIIGLSSLLADQEFSEEEKSMLDTIGSSGQSLLNLLNDVLDLSKVEAGRMMLQQEPVDLRNCLRRLDHLFAYRAETKGIEFRCSLDDSAPAIIHSDGDRLMQVLNNLVGNALKFTTEGKVEVRVRAEPLVNVEELDLWSSDETSYSPYRLFFEVEDTGIGISAEQRVLLFQPFAQADPTIRKRFGGTGLGLVISRKLAKLMGGDIDLQSEYGKGSTFTVSIKVDGKGSAGDLKLENNAESPPELPKHVLNRRLANQYPMQVLVVDDVTTNRLVMKTLLKRMGYDPVLLSGGHQAIEWLAEHSVDLVFLDMVMPDLNGMDTARAIRHREYSNQLKSKGIYIVALTANTLMQDRDECMEAGMNEFMSKPVRIPLVEDCIKRVSEARRVVD